jgi:hypothetical protein
LNLISIQIVTGTSITLLPKRSTVPVMAGSSPEVMLLGAGEREGVVEASKMRQKLRIKG